MTQRWKNRPDGSNWGEFGPDDQKGRLNLLTPERVVRSVREVKTGERFVCPSLLTTRAAVYLILAAFPRVYLQPKGVA